MEGIDISAPEKSVQEALRNRGFTVVARVKSDGVMPPGRCESNIFNGRFIEQPA
jgi:hypothetical protein